jgi:TPR repeat protein
MDVIKMPLVSGLVCFLGFGSVLHAVEISYAERAYRYYLGPKVDDDAYKNQLDTLRAASGEVGGAPISDLELHLGLARLDRAVDYTQAVRYALLAVENNEALGHLLLAQIYYDGVVPDPDLEIMLPAARYQKAFEHAMCAANSGLAAAEYLCGVCYLIGRGTSADFAKAQYWLGLAAAKGYSPAISLLGISVIM